ncbi:MAG TPA: dihydropteroate synthase [Candidatus Nanopelagicales bacterium]|nr:dihydropteroate synthase [Candidatus Nanopelagicales bacterium]
MSGLPQPSVAPGAPVVWGVLNVTPDSFSDGGLFDSVDLAVEQGHRMRAQGADVVDVGGESTRPGAQRITADAECARVLPVIEEVARSGIAVSVDTMRADVAEEAVKAGASIVNDVSGGRADERMHEVVAGLGVPYVIMHWRGHSDRMDELAQYHDPVGQVCEELREQVEKATAAGIEPSSLILDPGLGFAKNAEHNWTVLRGLDRLNDLGLPLLVGPSRKRFLGTLLADADGTMRETSGRDVATSAMSALLTERGVWGLRVHDVQGTIDAIKVSIAMREGQRHE